MSELNRKDFLQTLALGGGSLLASRSAVDAQAAQMTTMKPPEVTLKNDHFELFLGAVQGFNVHLKHVPSGTVLADYPYSYSFDTPVFALVSQDANSATFKGVTNTGLEMTHTFRLPPKSPWLEEEISIHNTNYEDMRSTFRCGFVLPVSGGTLKDYTFTSVPFRREPRNNEPVYADYSIQQILHQKRISNLRENSMPYRVYENYISEGWAATNGTTGFLFTKYNDKFREWAILDRVPVGPAAIGLRWGGAGVDASDAEGFIVIGGGESHSFGTSRVTAFTGDLTQGYYAFRDEMASHGHGVPAGFNPPVHWNELYDNKLWWLTTDGGQNNPDNRKKYYTVDDLKGEAAKAKAIGCEALYCDPGWDTNFASKIWDEPRLGKMSDFVAMLKNDYGLKLSLHTPLSGWCDSSTYPRECFLMDAKGGKNILCGASQQYVDETTKRLHTLAEAGATFFMFDGTQFQRECWDPSHEHHIPSTMADHVDATNLLARKVHEKYPKVLIEMHDQAAGPGPIRYVPLYYGHGADGAGVLGFDTVWAFEMMWDPIGDLLAGHSILFYYYNLAYGMPLYIHVDLRRDTEQALMLWWNMSTCRHIGFGGTPTNGNTKTAQFAAVKDYIRLKPCYAAGTFYGIDEMTHVHRHPEQNMAAMNCFNLGDGTTKDIPFDPAKFGLKPDRKYKFTGADATPTNNAYVLKVAIHGQGHTLVEVTEA
jgi:hypothetical protein